MVQHDYSMNIPSHWSAARGESETTAMTSVMNLSRVPGSHIPFHFRIHSSFVMVLGPCTTAEAANIFCFPSFPMLNILLPEGSAHTSQSVCYFTFAVSIVPSAGSPATSAPPSASGADATAAAGISASGIFSGGRVGGSISASQRGWRCFA